MMLFEIDSRMFSSLLGSYWNEENSREQAGVVTIQCIR